MALNYLEQRRRGLLSGAQGDMVVWNQIAPNLNDTSFSWNLHEGASAGKWVIQPWDEQNGYQIQKTSTTASSTYFMFYYYPIPFEEGHTYFSNCMIKITTISDSGTNLQNMTRFRVGSTTSTGSGGSFREIASHKLTLNTWGNCSSLFTFYRQDEVTSGYEKKSFVLSHIDPWAVGPFYYYIKAPTIIDLTKMFERYPEYMPSDANTFFNLCVSNGKNLNNYQARNVNGTRMLWRQ